LIIFSTTIFINLLLYFVDCSIIPQIDSYFWHDMFSLIDSSRGFQNCLDCSNEHDGCRPHGTSLFASWWHNVDLIGIVGVEVGHDIAGVHSVQVQIVVVVVVVIDVVVDVDDKGHDANGECRKVHSFGSAYDGCGGCIFARGGRRRALIDEGQLSLVFFAVDPSGVGDDFNGWLVVK